MSTATAGHAADTRFIQEAIPLLKEYTEKLRELSQEAGEINQSAGKNRLTGRVASSIETTKRDEVVQRWQYLKPPSEELAHQASAILEEGRINGLDRVQLWLRLSEFEHYLAMAQKAVERINSITK